MSDAENANVFHRPQEQTMSDAENELKSRIKNKRVVVITGTGVTTALCGRTAPSYVSGWAAFVMALGRACQQRFAVNDNWWTNLGFARLEQSGSPTNVQFATQNLVNWHQQVQNVWSPYEVFNHLAVNLFANLRVKDTSIAVALEALSVPLMTTNYDTLLEQASERVPLSIQSIHRSGWQPYIGGGNVGPGGTLHSRYVVHLHGIYYDTRDIVLSPNQYQMTLTEFRHYMSDLVTGVFATGESANLITTSLLFVGAEGTVFDTHFQSLWNQTASSPARHFILVRADKVQSTQDHLVQLQLGHRFSVIGYGNEYKDLPLFLHRLNLS